jgi:hypothetical protein
MTTPIPLTDTDRVIEAWLQTNPTEAEPGAYPKLLYNINLPPVLVHTAEQEHNMGANWRPVNLLLPEPPADPDVAPVTIDPTSAALPAAAGSGTFSVTIDGPGIDPNWTASKDAAADWLTISPETPQAIDGDVTYTVTENLGGARAANVYVNGKTFAINQAGV